MKPIFLLCFLLFLTACGYQKPEGDKHPNIPMFSEKNNTIFTFTEIIKDFYPDKTPPYFIRCSDDYWFIDIEQKDNPHLLVCDNNFKLLTQLNDIQSNKKFFRMILEDGTMYMISRDFDDATRDSIYKYAPPLFQKKHIEVLDIKPTYNDVYKQELEKRQVDKIADAVIRDSLKRHFHKVADSLYQIECEALLKVDKVQGCLRSSLHSIILYEDNKEFVVPFPHCQEVIGTFPKINTINHIKSKKTTTENLQKFDYAVIGNRSTGNHFVFGFHPYGYHYYKLIIGKDTTRFKSEKEWKQFYMEDGRVILRNQDNKILVVHAKE